MGFLLNEIFKSLNYLVYLHLQDPWVQCQTFFSIWPKSDGGATVNVAHIHIPHITCRKGLKKKKAKGTVSVICCLYNKPLSKLSGLRQQLFSLCVLSHFSYVQLFSTPWTISHQAPLSMDFPDKNTGVRCHFLLHRIFPTQGLNLHLLHCRWILLPLSHWKPISSQLCSSAI